MGNEAERLCGPRLEPLDRRSSLGADNRAAEFPQLHDLRDASAELGGPRGRRTGSAVGDESNADQCLDAEVGRAVQLPDGDVAARGRWPAMRVAKILTKDR